MWMPAVGRIFWPAGWCIRTREQISLSVHPEPARVGDAVQDWAIATKSVMNKSMFTLALTQVRADIEEANAVLSREIAEICMNFRPRSASTLRRWAWALPEKHCPSRS